MENNNNGRRIDPYEEQYRRQLERFSRMAGDEPGEADFSFGPADDAFADEFSQSSPYPQGNITSRNYSEHPMRSSSGYTQDSRQYAPQQEYSSAYREAPRTRSARRDDRPRQAARQHAEPRRAAYREEETVRRQPRPKKAAKPQKAAAYHAPKDTGRPKSSKKKSEPVHHKKKYNSSELQFGGNRGGGSMEREERHPIRKFFRTLILLLLVIFIGLNALLYYYIGLVKQRERGDRMCTDGSLTSKSVTNILLIGSDTRDDNEYGRTDTMILLSVNKSDKTITMTSFMRDMYVNIKGRNRDGEELDFWDKLNSAYVYGGAELLMDTIEYNFDVSVDDYVYVDFFAFIDIVDSVGGIELDISDEEAAGMEDPMREQNRILGQAGSTDLLEHGGKLTVNGNQALGYARLRYVGNADFQRTERQREVISKLIAKVKSSDPVTVNRFAKTFCSKLSTNMSKPQMMMMTYKALFSVKYEIKSLRLPAEGDYGYGIHGDQSTLDVDFDACRELLRKEIYK